MLRAALSASCVAATVAAGSLLALDLGQEACDKTATEVAEDGARLVQLGQQPHLCPFAVECADVLDDADVVAAPVGVESEARPWRQRSGRWSHALKNLSATSPYVLGDAGGTHHPPDPGLRGWVGSVSIGSTTRPLTLKVLQIQQCRHRVITSGLPSAAYPRLPDRRKRAHSWPVKVHSSPPS